MHYSSWLHCLLRAATGPSPPRPRPAGYRPGIEGLEQRCLLSVGFSELGVPSANSEPFGITTGRDGNLWFIEDRGNKVGRITPGGSITEFPIPTGSSFPKGIAAALDGNLWFTEDNGNKIGRINPFTATPANPGITEYAIPTAGSGPAGITAGPDGNLWFTEDAVLANKIGRINPFTATPANPGITEYPTAGAPNGIAAGPDGNLWFTEINTYKIGRMTPGGTVTGEFAVPTVGSNVYGIAAGPDGNLWFTEENTNQLGRITTGGSISEFTIPTPSGDPTEITTGPDGNVWFTISLGNQIGRITPDGSITAYNVPAASSYPLGITAGPDGNVWFTEYGGNKIGQFSLLSATAAPLTLSVGRPFAGAVASFGVADYADKPSDFNATITWGDGSTSGGVITGNAAYGFAVTATHTYNQVGSYAASVTVTNNNATPNLGFLTPSNASASFAVTVGSATHLTFLQQPSSEFAGQPLSPAVSVGVEDSSDHLLTGDTSTITLSLATNAFAATLGGTLSAPAVNGIATFSNLSVNHPGAGYTLLAGAGNLTGAQSAPFTSTAVDVAVGSDNQARLLWDNVDGRARVQSINNSFQVSNTALFGPFSGYTAQRVATGSDGLTRLLFTHTDGSYALWLLNASGTPVAEPSFPAVPGETALDVAVGSDNKAHLLWDYSDGRVAVGTVDNAGTITNVQVFGPFAGWSAAHLAAGSDGATRLLWTHTSGAFALWRLDANNVPLSEPSFGPYTGLTATDVAVGADNKARVLLDNVNGQANVWTIDNSASISNQQTLGPSAGYLASGLAGGRDGLTRVVWDHQDGGSVALFLLNADNTYTSGVGFNPWLPGGQAPSHAPDFSGAGVSLVSVDMPASAPSASAPQAAVGATEPMPSAAIKVAAKHAHAQPPPHHRPIIPHGPASHAAHRKGTGHAAPHHATSSPRADPLGRVPADTFLLPDATRADVAAPWPDAALIGGTGRNVIIGGGGADTLKEVAANTGDNLLGGGTTDYDQNLAALNAIFAEWTRTDLGFNDRISELLNGTNGQGATPLNKLNGQLVLLNNATVHADNAPDTLTGGGKGPDGTGTGRNWFLVDADDTITNFRTGKNGDRKTVIR